MNPLFNHIHKTMNEYDYNKYVVSRHNLFDQFQQVSSKHFKGSSYLWNMKYLQVTEDSGLYRVGFTSTSHLPVLHHEFDEYWWCRHYHWRPFWGAMTRNHAAIITHLREYWFQRWLKEQEEKREIILSASKLPEVLVDEIVGSIPYMYQTKRV